MNRNRRGLVAKVGRALPVIALLVGVQALPAGAADQTAAPANVAWITCPQFLSCVLTFHDNGGDGYWMARQVHGRKWVRLGRVPSWTKVGIPPITCKYQSRCFVDYVEAPGGGYFVARLSAGTRLVRLTLVQNR